MARGYGRHRGDSAGRPEALDPNAICRDPGVDDHLGGGVGEAGRAADVGRRPVGHEPGRRSSAVRRPAAGPRRAALAGVDDGGLGAGQLVGVVEVGRACAPTPPGATGRRPVARAWRSMAISGTTPEPPPTSSGGRRPPRRTSRRSGRGPPARRRARRRRGGTRDLAVRQPLDGELQLARSSGAEATEYERWAV